MNALWDITSCGLVDFILKEYTSTLKIEISSYSFYLPVYTVSHITRQYSQENITKFLDKC
jgi:hypothetical protein